MIIKFDEIEYDGCIYDVELEIGYTYHAEVKGSRDN